MRFRSAVNAPKRPSVQPGSAKVVLAEDDSTMRTLLAYTLRCDGHDVIEAGDGAELLEQIGILLLGPEDGSVPKVIVSDLRMPEYSGMDVLEALRRAEKSIPFLLITAFGDDEVHAEARRLGASVLDKPFLIEDFLAAVHQVLSDIDTTRDL